MALTLNGKRLMGQMLELGSAVWKGSWDAAGWWVASWPCCERRVSLLSFKPPPAKPSFWFFLKSPLRLEIADLRRAETGLIIWELFFDCAAPVPFLAVLRGFREFSVGLWIGGVQIEKAQGERCVNGNV